jgi:late competence protein required for DNA uptake (superfamily II DNA/RNA helicase)
MNAKKLKNVMCTCGSQVSDEILIELNSEKWEELKQKEIGFLIPVAKFKCFDCGYERPIEDIRKLGCEHVYCVNCLKLLMKDFCGSTGLKCKCHKDIDMDVLESVDKELYCSYTYKLSAGKISKGNYYKH